MKPHGGGSGVHIYASHSQNGAGTAINVNSVSPRGGFTIGETTWPLLGSSSMASAASGTMSNTAGGPAIYPPFWGFLINASNTANESATLTIFVAAMAKP